MTVQVILIIIIKNTIQATLPYEISLCQVRETETLPPFCILFVRKCQHNNKYSLYFKRNWESDCTNFDFVQWVGSKFDQVIWLRYVVKQLLRPTHDECQ
jgi:hypothetical protein